MALAVGSIAPDFTAKDDEGNTVTLSALKGKTVVLYFYPKDDTPGCTKQAQSFRDNYQQYRDKEIVVLGVSVDDEASHQEFKKKYDLPFNLIADTTKEVTRAYDVDGGGYSKRVTYVIDPEGKIAHVDASVNTATHASDVLDIVG
jgi:peroxiredoxin Q/BCP